MRKRLWYYLVRNVMPGAILPTWLQYVRCVLFPLDTFYWKMSKSRGYDPEYDVWRIEGVTYSAKALSNLAKAQGDTLKVTRVNNNTIVLRQKECVELNARIPLDEFLKSQPNYCWCWIHTEAYTDMSYFTDGAFYWSDQFKANVYPLHDITHVTPLHKPEPTK